MSTSLQSLVRTAVLGSGLVLVSCSAAPEVANPDPIGQMPMVQPAPLGETDQPAAAAQPDGDAVGKASPAPDTSSRTAELGVGGAVIHARRSAPVVHRPSAWPRMQPLYDEAQTAMDRYDYHRAEDLFRELRDSPWTPQTMRERFHASAFRAADLGYSIDQVRSALDREDYQEADRSFRSLTRSHPAIPVRVLIPEANFGPKLPR